MDYCISYYHHQKIELFNAAFAAGLRHRRRNLITHAMQDALTTSFHRSIPILYQDEYFVAFDKPSGVLVIPSPKKERYTLLSLVNDANSSKEEGVRLHPCHRLDRDTSGSILFAWGKKNQQMMMKLFHRHQVKKKYIAFTQGRIKIKQGEFRSAIKDFDQRRFSSNANAKLAITRFKVIALKRDYSIVEVFPVTGRTNQIRIQFAEAGFPLVGERKYAFAKDFALKFRRVALHACEIDFVHPVKRNPVNIISPLPKDMEEFTHTH